MKTIILRSIQALLLYACIYSPYWKVYGNGTRIDSLKKVIAVSPDDSTKVYSLLSLCEYLKMDDPDSYKKYTEELIQLSEDIVHNEGLALGYNNYGAYYINKGEYEPALKHLLIALDIMEVKQLEKFENKPLSNIGLVYYQLKEYKKAAEYTKRALEKAAFSKNKRQDSLSALTNLGIIHQMQGEINMALEVYLKASELAKKENDINGVIYNLINIGVICVNQKKYEEALLYYQRALKEALVINDMYSTAYIYLNMGALKKEQSELIPSIVYFEECLTISKEMGLKEVEKHANAYLSDVYAQLKKFDKAYTYQREYARIKDSILKEVVAEKIVEMESQYAAEEKDDEIGSLEEELKTSEERHQQNLTNWKSLLFMGLIGLLIALGVIWHLYQKKTKAEQISELLKASHDSMMKQYLSIESTNKTYKEQLLKVIEKYEATEKPINKVAKKGEYKSSPLTKEQKEKFADKILSYMELNRPYLKADLNLEKLAKEIALSTHHISEVLNQSLGQNFYTIVNSYRVEAFKQKVAQGDAKNKTLLAIALDCGFNSKTSFNRIFKSHTGLTPRQFHDIIKRNTYENT